jgi:hypothetical protein
MSNNKPNQYQSSFPTKENPQPCKNTCGTKIYLAKHEGRYLPFELSGEIHKCPKRPKQEQQLTNGNNNGNSDLTLELVLRKLESIGIKIDLTKLRNAVNGEIK